MLYVLNFVYIVQTVVILKQKTLTVYIVVYNIHVIRLFHNRTISYYDYDYKIILVQ